ncbi:MAG: TonB-dependent receptor [Acidobacteriota bacterium]|nr:TonB-dependent receptor [Acidobacteriota bacterium]
MCRALKSFIQTTITCVALMILFVFTATAQTTTASITGRVVDGLGNVVPNARVTATDKGTGQTRSVVTDTDGAYTLTGLAPGRYSATVEAQSFSKALLEDFELNVGATQTLNFGLKPGNVSETVTVTGEQPLIETTKSDINQSITPTEIQNLPLLNRTFAGLSIIVPEARPVGNFDPTKTRIGNFAMNGGDGRQLNVNVDGGDNKDNVVGSLLQNFSYESVQEFRVLQHRWTAEQGRAVGGIIDVITKSGTNDFRGSAFANFRDEAWRSLDFFDKRSRAANPNYQKPKFERQEFGGSIGGPIVKEKLFFFFALERFRERQNNALRPDVISEIQLIPGAQFVPEIATPYNDLLLSAKVDHKISDNQSMFYRYSYQKNDSPNDQIAVPAATDLSGGNTNDNKLHSFVVNHTYNLSSNMLNQFTFHFQDFNNAILGVTDTPLLQFPGGISIGQNANVPQATTERKYQFRDDFTVIAGDHSVKFGVNYINTKLGGFFFFGARGYALTFNALPSAIRNLPQGFATPGIVSALTFSDGEGFHDQKIHQLAFYVQDDWKVNRKLTFNLGLRWDANIGNLPDQTNNRTIRILKQLNDPLARAITGDDEKLSRTTPSWTEFQPRVGFAYDPSGKGKTVIRGGYGIFYDQLFQNLTLFSLTQSNPVLYQTALPLNQAQLAAFRFGVDSLPAVPAGFSFTDLAFGGFGRINDPDAKEPYVQKFSFGFQHELTRNLTISSDYVHTLGIHEPRVQNINPLIQNICDPTFPGSTPTSPLCVRGASSRRLDRAFVNSGFPVTGGRTRIEQINMIGTTNRSLFDSLTTTLKYRSRRMLFNASYVLASSRSWGGQPVASYSGNGIATTPENQFKEEEFGPTRIDERHRIVISGVFELPYGFQIAPILQFASSRPYSPNAGVDIDGDGLPTNDRLCAGVDPLNVLNAVRNRPTTATPTSVVLGLNPRGCQQAQVNSQRKGYIVGLDGSIEERSGRFFNVDMRVTKTFRFGERFRLSAYADFYNLFNTENLSFASRLGLSNATAAGINARPNATPPVAGQFGSFLQPVSLFGPGFGPPVGRPFTAQFGLRFTF